MNTPASTETAPKTDSPTTTASEAPAEVDRRGKPLPPRQRVGGIITPQ